MNPLPLAGRVYSGWVTHTRRIPPPHQFRIPASYWLLDVDQIRNTFSLPLIFWHRSPALLGFRRKHYLGPSHLSLREAVRLKLMNELGRQPQGKVYLLTQISSLGLTFNPVSFYYCLDESNSRVDAILAEITNTPWGERFTYAIDLRDTSLDLENYCFRFNKRFHVSPFLGMDYEYGWRFSFRHSILSVQMTSYPQVSETSSPLPPSPAFSARLDLAPAGRNPLAQLKVALHVLLMPWITVLGIYAHAALLYLSKKARFYPHPRTRNEPHPFPSTKPVRVEVLK